MKYEVCDIKYFTIFTSDRSINKNVHYYKKFVEWNQLSYLCIVYWKSPLFPLENLESVLTAHEIKSWIVGLTEIIIVSYFVFTSNFFVGKETR